MCEVHALDPGLGQDLFSRHRKAQSPWTRWNWSESPEGRGQEGARGWVHTLTPSLSLLTAQSPGAVEEILDRENKRMADTLASKVTRLKSVSGGPLLSPPSGLLEEGVRGRVEAWKGSR